MTDAIDTPWERIINLREEDGGGCVTITRSDQHDGTSMHRVEVRRPDSSQVIWTSAVTLELALTNALVELVKTLSTGKGRER